MAELSVSEIMAERIYELFRTGRMGTHTLIHNFHCLAGREDKNGAFYLTWLIGRSNHQYFLKLLMDASKTLCT
jgi:hypothetical protein